MAPAVTQNSTNVRASTDASSGAPAGPADGSGTEPRRRPRRRSVPLAVRAARAGFRVLAPYAPALASNAAERLFLTARRHSRPAWEAHALAGAERFTIPHDGQALPAWRWGTGTNVVLLVHGWEGRGSQLASFAEPLVRQGFSVVTFDVASAGAYLGRLHAIIGHSVGGAAALFATRLGLKVDRLALVAPPVSPQRFAAEFDGPLLVVHDRGDRVVPIDDGEVIAGAAIGGRLFETHRQRALLPRPAPVNRGATPALTPSRRPRPCTARCRCRPSPGT